MDENLDSMDWRATTPPSHFHPYTTNAYIPGGWPLEAPTPTPNFFARKRPEGGFLPDAKRICLGIISLRLWAKKSSYKASSVFKQYIIISTRAIIQRYKNYCRRRRRAVYNARPYPHLRESPFQRAIRVRETPFERLVRLGARSDYQTLRSRPNPFAQLANPPPFSLNTDTAATYTALPNHIPWFEEPMPFVKRHPSENPFSNIPVLPPPPPRTNTDTALRTVADIPLPSGTVQLDDFFFPNLKPEAVFPHIAKTTPPSSPSARLVACLYNLPYHSELPQAPSAQLDQPSTQLDQPSTQLDQPSTQFDQPSTQFDQPSTQLDQASAQLLTDLNSPQYQTELSDALSTRLDSPSAYLNSSPQLDSPSAQLAVNLSNHLYLASSPDSASAHLKRILSNSRHRTSAAATYGMMRRGPRGPRNPLRFPRNRMLTSAIKHTISRSNPGEDATDSWLSTTTSPSQIEIYLVEPGSSQSELPRHPDTPCPPPRTRDDAEQTPQSDEAMVGRRSPELCHNTGEAPRSDEAGVEQRSSELCSDSEQPQSDEAMVEQRSPELRHDDGETTRSDEAVVEHRSPEPRLDAGEAPELGEAVVEQRSPELRPDPEQQPQWGEAMVEQHSPESRHDDGLEEEQTLQDKDVVALEDTPANENPPSPVAASPEELADFGDMKIESEPESPEKPVSPKAVRYGTERTSRQTRAQVAKEKHEKETRAYKKLAPLDADWEARVVAAVQHGHGNFQPSDLRRVVPLSGASGATDNWLNDEVINEYLKLIVTHGKKNDRGGQVPSHHSFNSFFFSNLAEKGPESIKRWAQRAKISGRSLLQTKAVFIPINSGAHWTLAVVSGENKTITHYNSLAGDASRKLGVIKSWVEAELGSAFKEEDWSLAEGQSPRQANMDDCGVFTVTSARQIMLGFTPMSYGPDDIGVQRQRIVAELVNGGLLRAAEDAKETTG
ncbi:hypothetical protein DV736_g4973, partial [Chaetothyriales sp. CBS 134916]